MNTDEKNANEAMDLFEQSCRHATNTLEALLPYVQTTISPRVLRTMKSKKMPNKYLGDPFTCGGRTLRFVVHMSYTRYLDDNGKIRERGSISIYPEERNGDGGWWPSRVVTRVYKEYYKAEEVPALLLEMKPIVLRATMSRFHPDGSLV